MNKALEALKDGRTFIIFATDTGDYDESVVTRLEAFSKTGEIQPGMKRVTPEEYEKHHSGRVKDCFCKQIQCVCEMVRNHQETCKFRRAVLCSIPIACEEHDRDVCPACDACDCRDAGEVVSKRRKERGGSS